MESIEKQTAESFIKLKSYCELQKFKGWDPYDGLNSRIFKALPFRNWDLARLAWIQGFKRSPINLRKILFVPKQYNAKGIGLFLSGYCNLYLLAKKGDNTFGTKEEFVEKIIFLADMLIELQNKNYSGACWGYNFDWQARRLFLFPKNTPTIVATTFCASALFEAYEITKKEIYLKTALSSADFVLNDLKRTSHFNGFLFAYSPLNGNNTVYNASLLGAKLLSICYQYTNDANQIETARKAVLAACEGQQKDGSWVYGLLPVQSWIDSFHTGYNIDAINTYQNSSNDFTFSEHLELGSRYYIENFFESDGKPKYYHNATYPVDIHCPAQLFVTISKLDKLTENKALAKKVMKWTIENMQNSKGYFYYQLKKGINSKISYMRWSNAFMFNAMTLFLKENSKM